MGEPSAMLNDGAASIPWYHTIDLPGGPTPGEFDLRPVTDRVPLPGSLAGRRCLDVGTHDGFWAFEMEGRGAAEVMAIDIDDANLLDWPEPRPELGADVVGFIADRKRAFGVAHHALGSKVVHRYVSVYDLTPSEVGEFDFVFVGTLLHHLRDPVGALMSIRRVCRGELLVSGVFSVGKTVMHPRTPVAELSDLPNRPLWQLPNLAGLRRQIQSAGFEVVKQGRPYFQRYGAGHHQEGLMVGGLRLVPSRVVLRYGVPHVGVLARPVGR